MHSLAELYLSTMLVISLSLTFGVNAHMSIWHPSMYGVGPNFETVVPGNPANPIGPDLASQDDWWFRGPQYRALKPQNDSVMSLPAGGKVDIEIACNAAFTSYGISPSDLSDSLSACPGNSGAHHSGTPGEAIDDDLLSGCALGIADKDDIEKVGWDDLAIFSVNQRCVKGRVTSFEIPDKMPKCTGDKCSCGWFWLANNGTGNFYMTAFDCAVIPGASPAPILPVVDAQFCPNSTCIPTKGAKRPLYAYNSPTNIVWQGNEQRPGYHPSWSFFDGPQNDIFDLSASATSVEANSTGASSSSLKPTESRSIKSSNSPSTSSAPTSRSVSASSAIPSHSTSLAKTTTTHMATTIATSVGSTSSRSSVPSSLPNSDITRYSIETILKESTTSTSTTEPRRISLSPPSSASRPYSSTAPSVLPSDFAATFTTGEALKLALPTFDVASIRRRHEASHAYYGRKRNAIADDLLRQAESQGSNANRLRIGSLVVLVSFACMYVVL